MPVDVEVFGQLLAGQPRRRSIEISAPTPARNLALKIGLDIDQIGLIISVVKDVNKFRSRFPSEIDGIPILIQETGELKAL